MSKTPVVLVGDARTGSLEIAGLSVLDRLVVTAHRAGCAPIFVVSKTLPSLTRARALGIEVFHELDVPTALSEPVLFIEGSLLVEVRDLENVIAQGGQLVSAEGETLPVRMLGRDFRPVTGGPVATAIVDDRSASDAEQRLWASLSSTADGLVDRFVNRPLGRPLSKLLVRTLVSPNQVSIVSILIGIVSAWLFARGNFVAGALVLQLCAIIDCVDGDLARALFKQSSLGKWLDLGGDQVVHFSVFAGVGIGVARFNPSVPAMALGLSAAVGVLLCFAVIVRALQQPHAQRRPLLSKLLDTTANRDFSVLLLALAIFDGMDLFLWMAGIGIHVFWILLIALVVLGGSRAAPVMSRESV